MNALSLHARRACLAVSLLGLGLPVQAELPHEPEVPTKTACLEFAREAHLQLNSLYKEKRACMNSSSPGPFRVAPDCKVLTFQVKMTLQAWPQCTAQEAQICEMWRLSARASKCLAAATSEESASKLMGELKGIGAKPREWMAATSDPVRFLREKATGVAASVVNANVKELLNASRPSTGFVNQGTAQTQELYEFLFRQSIGNEPAYSRNGLIAAIQGAAAEEIRRSHMNTLHELEGVAAEIQSFGVEATPPSRSNPFRNARNGADPNPYRAVPERRSSTAIATAAEIDDGDTSGGRRDAKRNCPRDISNIRSSLRSRTMRNSPDLDIPIQTLIQRAGGVNAGLDALRQQMEAVRQSQVAGSEVKSEMPAAWDAAEMSQAEADTLRILDAMSRAFACYAGQ